MRYLSKNNTIEEFNNILKEGLEYGYILKDVEDEDLILELYNNLTKMFKFYKSWQELKQQHHVI